MLGEVVAPQVDDIVWGQRSAVNLPTPADTVASGKRVCSPSLSFPVSKTKMLVPVSQSHFGDERQYSVNERVGTL